MADVSALKIGDISYNIKDKTARESITTTNNNVATIERNMLTATYNSSNETISFSTASTNA